MDANSRMEHMDEELKLLKNEIKQVLLEVQEHVLNAQNPFVAQAAPATQRQPQSPPAAEAPQSAPPPSHYAYAPALPSTSVGGVSAGPASAPWQPAPTNPGAAHYDQDPTPVDAPRAAMRAEPVRSPEPGPGPAPSQPGPVFIQHERIHAAEEDRPGQRSSRGQGHGGFPDRA